MKSILHEVTVHKAITESELLKKFITSEDLKQLTDLKAASIKLANYNKVNMMTNTDGTYILTEIPKEWH